MSPEQKSDAPAINERISQRRGRDPRVSAGDVVITKVVLDSIGVRISRCFLKNIDYSKHSFGAKSVPVNVAAICVPVSSEYKREIVHSRWT